MGNNHLVIMAGGVGSRFWPVSTSTCPKQFIDVLGTGKSLLQMTVERFSRVILPENVWIVTSKGYAELVAKQLPHIDPSHILLEPCMRNTAPCIAYVGWKIRQRYPDANIVVTPSDHLVLNTEDFAATIANGLRYTEENNAIITLGIHPYRPETGYGYIETGKAEDGFYKVASFKEKPDYATACHYLEHGGYYWNSGIFIWNVNTLIYAIKTYQPELGQLFDKLAVHFYTPHEQEMVDKFFPTCPNISIDYAVMEHASNIYMIGANFTWSDLGTWGSLYENTTHDDKGNAISGANIHLIDAENCIVKMPGDKKVVVQGLNGYIIAENENTLLICKLTEEQHIKDFSKLVQ